MAGSKCTQTRHNRIYYTLAFLDYYAPINVDVHMLVECGMWELSGCSLVVIANGSSLSVLIQSHYYWLFFASIGMYSRYNY